MDVILIGKRGRKISEKPVCIYAGQSRTEALAEGAKRREELPEQYFVNPQPFQNVRHSATVAAQPLREAKSKGPTKSK